MKSKAKPHSSVFLDAYLDWLSYEARFVLNYIDQRRPPVSRSNDTISDLIELCAHRISIDAGVLRKEAIDVDLEWKCAELAAADEFKHLRGLPEIEKLITQYKHCTLRGLK